MSIRNILVAFNGAPGAETALRYAAGIAQNGDTHVTALVAHSGHETVSSQAPWVPVKAREIIAAANAEIIDEIRKAFDRISQELGLGERLHYIDATGRVDTVISETARGFDLLVVGRPSDGDADEHVVLHPDRIALMSGRPVMVIPAGYERKARHERAAVAWDGSRAAGRALFDSLQLLEDNGEVTVLTIEGTEIPRPVGEVIDHLDRHGIAARHEELLLKHGIARTLLAYAAHTDPCVMIMGAYEHSKFREDFLGGVTARVLRDIRIPVLLSH
ncbi:universal stress protein [Tropicimonas sp. TH_r6]|uniref:universal stress protein n=1 Tax=Tropicimonas sp. TH_r6 TaxID=3082085 RepID=UPI002952F6C3|nr:universal stress protein [Tropicimonas sp. TH_r6]MDV7145613.1 universal stress protein [Tropicimonas sp. TH_r6]